MNKLPNSMNLQEALQLQIYQGLDENWIKQQLQHFDVLHYMVLHLILFF